jgi:hypothetical protein
MNRLQAQSARFEDIAAKVLAAAGYEVEREVRADVAGQMFAIDLMFRNADGLHYLAEVKWTRLDPVPLQMLRDWAARLTAYKTSLPESQLVLIVSGVVEEAHRDWLKQQFGVNVWDAEHLKLLAHDDGELFAQLLIFEEATKKLEAERLKTRNDAIPAAEFEREENPPLQTPGAALIAQLKAIPPGNKGAKAYERVCIDIIDYLFGEHLIDARPQSRTEDGLDVFDIVYRVRPNHNFWTTLTRDFRARVIMFEFKNYNDPIGPQQVYTTERYMSGAALRPICFLVSRHAPHAHAELAAFGSMRESGKLLIFLSDADLLTMLRFRDAEIAAFSAGKAVEDDPTVILDQKIYHFLATLGR